MSKLQKKLKILSRQIDTDGIYIPPGSDYRVRGGITGQCLLCGTVKPLRLGHIVPRWLYKWVKREGKIIGDYKTLKICAEEQDGRKHYLLCDSCEQFFGEAEAYVALLQDEDLQHKWPAVGLRQIKQNLIEGINYDLVLRFLLGVAFKAHHAESAPYHTITFSRGFYRDIIQSFRGEEAVVKFLIVAMRFYCKVSPDIEPRALVYLQRNYYKGLGETLAILAGGWEWLLIRRNKEIGLPFVEIADIIIRPGQPAFIPWGEITDHRFVK